jgi:hypothetical protein
MAVSAETTSGPRGGRGSSRGSRAQGGRSAAITEEQRGRGGRGRAGHYTSTASGESAHVAAAGTSLARGSGVLKASYILVWQDRA